MPIFIDASEGRKRSNTPHVSRALYVSGLEAATAADVLVSPVDLPFEALEEHLQRGILIQLKIGHDLIASIEDERLRFSLAKMQQVVSCSWQRWLVYTGNYRVSGEAEAILDGRPTGISWASLDGNLAAWGEGGGFVHRLENPGMLPGFLQRRLDRLTHYLQTGGREVYPVLDFPADQGQGILRQLKPVSDFRVMLTALPGVGVVGAQRLWDYFGKDPVVILAFLTDPGAAKLKERPQGFGPTTLAKIREYLKLPPNTSLTLK